ncbi:single-stranded DNA exonuclease RecJ, partial [Avibacterium paragallinarum]
MNKTIQRRPISTAQPISDHPLLDRLYRARQIENPQQLDR